MPATPLFPDPLENVVCHSGNPLAYLGSPSIAQMPNGDLFVTHDLFGKGAPHDPWGREYMGHIHKSTDGGKTWALVRELPNAYWSTLFQHDSALFLFGCSAEYGDGVIRRSEDGGRTWTTPVDAKSGLILPGGEGFEPPCYHSAPVPVVFHAGRVWRAFENNATRKWPQGFRSVVVSAAIDSDWLDAGNWTATSELGYSQEWNLPTFGENTGGWLEGNVVADRDGELWNILRCNSTPDANWCACQKIDTQNMRLSFDPQKGFRRFPGGMSKFTIRFDAESDRYWTTSNEVTIPENPTQRNTLILASSPDLTTWERRCVLLDDPDDKKNCGSQSMTGFQYVDWLISGNDMLLAVRTAYRGAHNFHDANYVTFHRVENFREL